MGKMQYRIPVAKLKESCPIELFDFDTTEEIKPLVGIIGQDRARRAVEFGLNVKNKGYNIYIAGLPGTGKTSYARSIIAEKAKEGATPDDWCYLYNFKEPESPIALRLPAGVGKNLQEDMANLIEELKQDVPKIFESKEFDKSKSEIMENYKRESTKHLTELEQYAKSESLLLQRTDRGLVTVVVYEGKPLGTADYANLPDDMKKTVDAKMVNAGLRIDETMRRIRTLERVAREELQAKEEEFGLSAIEPGIYSLKHKYQEYAQVGEYLSLAQKDILKNVKLFLPQEKSANVLSMFQPTDKDFFSRYKVNLFLDNSETKHAPVVWETNPTYYNLFGKIEGESRFGAVATDFTMIKKGSIHQANGGYLVIQTEDILKDALAWDTLKRTLENEEAFAENIGEHYKILPTVTLKPAPIPISVKVILIGSTSIYQLLYTYDQEFRKLFKIKAQFDSTMERTEENIRKYAEFINVICFEEGLRHFEAQAVANVVEHSCRLSGDKSKLSTRFNEIVEILYEANTWAQLENKPYVTAAHVRKALDEKVFRSNLSEEKIQESIEKGYILVDTEGEVIGQVNGLSVLSLGDYTFGQPSRITASTSLGKKGIINIEREAKMSGNIHDKGVLILSGYLGSKYATDKPLTLSASLCFEQNYGGVDGDSATCAELLALLSAIGDIPIRQNLAITGSLNQKGQAQPIGGVNEKIEGFYNICRQKGFTGDQGVVIPHQNVENLMLSNEVVDSVREGKFHVYSVKTIDDAIELMSGMAPEDFHRKVDRNLERLARLAESFYGTKEGTDGA